METVTNESVGFEYYISREMGKQQGKMCEN